MRNVSVFENNNKFDWNVVDFPRILCVCWGDSVLILEQKKLICDGMYFSLGNTEKCVKMKCISVEIYLNQLFGTWFDNIIIYLNFTLQIFYWKRHSFFSFDISCHCTERTTFPFNEYKLQFSITETVTFKFLFASVKFTFSTSNRITSSYIY